MFPGREGLSNYVKVGLKIYLILHAFFLRQISNFLWCLGISSDDQEKYFKMKHNCPLCLMNQKATLGTLRRTASILNFLLK